MTLRRISTNYGHRYTLDGRKVDGVTTLLSQGIAKPALTRWAAKAAAEYVADNLGVLNALPDRESVIATVKQSPWSQRDRAATRGTDIHALAERAIHGEELNLVEDDATYGAVSGYVRFLDEWKPEPLLTERPCASRKWWYAGTFDAILRLPSGETLLVDWKTSKGVYGETALQTAAYANAEFYLDDDGAEQPMPEVGGLAVVHITPTGTDLYRIQDADAAWKQFQHVAWVAKQTDAIKSQITEPEECPA
ncbi:MAG: hypothetical protein ACRDQA_26855 [Nocardioidaceae bacterium]